MVRFADLGVTLDPKYKDWRVTYLHVKGTGIFCFITRRYPNGYGVKRLKLNEKRVFSDY
jgi:hypothetical protein